jgi:transcriptional regulator of acetoin/glycerol metabolism
VTYLEAIRKARRDYLVAALRDAGGSVPKAAKRAGICRTSFYDALRRFNVPQRPSRGNDQWRALSCN